MLGLYVWAILIILIAICITPWWFFPTVVILTLTSYFMFGDQY